MKKSDIMKKDLLILCLLLIFITHNTYASSEGPVLYEPGETYVLYLEHINDIYSENIKENRQNQIKLKNSKKQKKEKDILSFLQYLLKETESGKLIREMRLDDKSISHNTIKGSGSGGTDWSVEYVIQYIEKKKKEKESKKEKPLSFNKWFKKYRYYKNWRYLAPDQQEAYKNEYKLYLKSFK